MQGSHDSRMDRHVGARSGKDGTLVPFGDVVDAGDGAIMVDDDVDRINGGGGGAARDLGVNLRLGGLRAQLAGMDEDPPDAKADDAGEDQSGNDVDRQPRAACRRHGCLDGQTNLLADVHEVSLAMSP